jgi:hypothetical protein
VIDARNVSKSIFLQGIFLILERAKNFREISLVNEVDGPFFNGFLSQELENS